MSANLAFRVYIATVLVTIIVYVFVVLRICKNDEISLGEAFGFSKVDKESKPRTKNVKSNSFSVKEQIKRLETELYATDDGDERKKLLDEIRELERQND